MSTNFRWKKERYRSVTLPQAIPTAESVADRQDAIDPEYTERAKASTVLLVGAGGLGGAVAIALARKGYGRIRICDGDMVEVSNLNRQVFTSRDLFNPKAFRLAKNAAAEGHLGSLCEGHAVNFAPETAEVLARDIDAAIVGVDHNPTRALAARLFRERRIPATFLAVDDQARFGWVFVQESVGPCLGCCFPEQCQPARRTPCRPTAATIDILRAVGALATYSLDSLLFPGRPRYWNFRTIHLAGGSDDPCRVIPVRDTCPLFSQYDHDEPELSSPAIHPETGSVPAQ